MFTGLLLILFRGLSSVGGWSRMWEINWQNDRIQFLNWSFSPFERHTIWSQLIGGAFLHLSVFSINQTQLQRLLTLPTLKKSQISLWISLPITMALSLITCLTGLVMYAYFKDCDPLLSKEVSKSDQMIPYMMVKLFSSYPPLSGLVIASIFAGAISSVASFVNSLAAVTLEEVIRPCFLNKHLNEEDKNSVALVSNTFENNNEKINEQNEQNEQNSNEKYAVIYSKLLGIAYGLLCLLIAYLCEKINRLLETCLALFGLAGGPMLAIFTLGIASRKCNANGAIFGFILSLIFGVLIGFGPILLGLNPTPLPRSIDGCENLNPLITHAPTTSSPLTNSTLFIHSDSLFLYLFKISYMWICPLTWSITTVAALIYSHLLPDKNLIVNEDLLMPILRRKTKNFEI